MSGYRSRVTKPTVFMWMLIVFADAGSSVGSGVTALVTAFAVGGLLVLMLLAGRHLVPVRQPVPVRRPIPARPPVRVPMAASAHRRGYAVARMSVRHHTS